MEVRVDTNAQFYNAVVITEGKCVDFDNANDVNFTGAVMECGTAVHSATMTLLLAQTMPKQTYSIQTLLNTKTTLISSRSLLIIRQLLRQLFLLTMI